MAESVPGSAVRRGRWWGSAEVVHDDVDGGLGLIAATDL